jgi:GMP reductase
MRIEPDVKLDYSSVLLRPKRSVLGSRKDVKLTRQFTFKNKSKWEGVPLMASNMDGVGTFDMADTLAEQRIFTCLVKTYSVEELAEFFNDTSKPERTNYVAMSIGILDHDKHKFEDVYKEVGDKLKYVCIDVANGYSERFLDFITNFSKKYPGIIIIAGNVVTADQTQELILNGADIVKVGIGPGSVCTTRLKTGVGYPQLSAVMECADAAHGLGGHIIADGGCTCPGDVAKAFAGGSDFVMLGGMLAGHDQGGGEIITKQYVTQEVGITEEKSFVQFYGMSSKSANEKHFGGLKKYRSSEGRTVLVPYRGNVNDTVQDILGGVRSACTYVGANMLKRLSKCATFIQVNNQLNTVYESSTIGE